MPVRGSGTFCTVEGCGKPNKGRGLCLNHYMLKRRNGAPTKRTDRNKRSHPLYSIWFDRKQSGLRCPEWLDFWTFVQSVGEKPKDCFLVRLRGDEPYGPTNFRWQPHLRRRDGESRKEWWARKWAARQAANPGLENRRTLRRRYGMTPEDYEALVESQGGVCAICGQSETATDPKVGTIRSLAVDHCHQTGRVRGALCFRCNTTIGKVGESIELLERAIAYLRRQLSK